MTTIRHGTLTADTVTTVSVTAATHACVVANYVTTISESHNFSDEFGEAEVINVDGTDEIYFRTDGTDPAVAGDDAHVLPASVGASLKIPIRGSTGTVKLISSGTPAYSVELR